MNSKRKQQTITINISVAEVDLAFDAVEHIRKQLRNVEFEGKEDMLADIEDVLDIIYQDLDDDDD